MLDNLTASTLAQADVQVSATPSIQCGFIADRDRSQIAHSSQAKLLRTYENSASRENYNNKVVGSTPFKALENAIKL